MLGRVAAVAAAAGLVVAVGAGAAPRTTTVHATEKEFKISTLPVAAKAGKVTFVVKNTGALKHEFIVLKTKLPAAKLPHTSTRALTVGRIGKVPEFAPGQTRRLTLTLAAGHYVLLCNVPGHYAAGQRLDFTVK